MTVDESVLDVYLRSYRDLIATEQVEGSFVLSLPLHLAANHRIEITVTRFGDDLYLISDSARTLGEIQAAGYSLTSQMKTRIESLAGVSGVRAVDTHLVLESTRADLGVSIQKFAEITKTIGDVYLVHRQHDEPDNEIILQVQAIVQAMGMHYRLNERVAGEIEAHPFDIVVPANGRPGMALSVVSGRNTHNLAQIWGFKCEDVKRGEWYRAARARVALVYDVRHAWSEASKAILESRADVAIASNALDELRTKVKA